VLVTDTQLLEALIHDDPATTAHRTGTYLVRPFEEIRWSGPDGLQRSVPEPPPPRYGGEFGEVEFWIEGQAGWGVLTVPDRRWDLSRTEARSS
jgi:hypothetical protein